MTVAAADDVRAAPARWGWAAALLVVALWTVGHIGCHRDEDTELGVTPPANRAAEQAP
jgi:hypothetical protein